MTDPTWSAGRYSWYPSTATGRYTTAFDGGTGKLPLCATTGHRVPPHLITLLARACSNGC
jgi:hypothetical protein